MSASKLNQSTIASNLLDNAIRNLNRKISSNTPYVPTLWERIGIDMPSEKVVYNVRFHEVWKWVEEQPIHMWKYYDVPLVDTTPIRMLTGNNYLFTDEMEAWFLLRWS